jgi:hypothetical protein
VAFVDKSVHLTQETSLCPEINVTGLVFHMEVTVVLEDSLFHFVVDQRAHVNVWDLNDDFKSNEVNDTVLHGVLIHQHVDVQELGNQVDDMRSMSNEKGQVWMLEVFNMIIDVFHQSHGVRNFWVKHQMKSTRTNELSQYNGVEGSYGESIVIQAFSIRDYVGNHKGTHGNLDGSNRIVLKQIPSDKLIANLAFLLASLAHHHNDHFREAMMEMNLRLVHDFLSGLH